MKKFLYNAVSIPLALILIVFSLNNREIVIIDVWPIYWNLEAPLFIVIIGALLIGIFWGFIITQSSIKKKNKLLSSPLNNKPLSTQKN